MMKSLPFNNLDSYEQWCRCCIISLANVLFVDVGFLKNVRHFKMCIVNCNFWQGAKPKLECGLAKTSVSLER